MVRNGQDSGLGGFVLGIRTHLSLSLSLVRFVEGTGDLYFFVWSVKFCGGKGWLFSGPSQFV